MSQTQTDKSPTHFGLIRIRIFLAETVYSKISSRLDFEPKVEGSNLIFERFYVHCYKITCYKNDDFYFWIDKL